MKQKITFLLLCAIIMSGCSGNVSESQSKSVGSDVQTENTTESVESEDIDTGEKIADVVESIFRDDPVKVISNDGNLTVHSVLLPDQGEKSGYIPFTYDDRYLVYLSYRYEQNYGEISYHDLTLYVIDAMNGTIVCESNLNTPYIPTWSQYTNSGLVIFDAKVDEGIYTVNCAYSIEKTGDRFTVRETKANAYPCRGQYFYTPDGTVAAYAVTDNGYGDGGIDIQYANGEVKRIFNNTMLEETGKKGDAAIGDVTGYTPHGFIDNTHLVYSITGWEWLKGYGIYNILTDTTEEVYGTYKPIGIHNGILYISSTEKGLETYSIEGAEIWSITSDGVKTIIASTDETEGVFSLTMDRYYTFDQSKFIFYNTGTIHGIEYNGADETITVSIYSPNLTELLAEIEYQKDMNTLENIIVYGDHVTVVIRADADID